MKRKQVTETEQLNENPLVLGLMAALVGMGLEKEKAKKAAAQAVDQAQSNISNLLERANASTGRRHELQAQTQRFRQ